MSINISIRIQEISDVMEGAEDEDTFSAAKHIFFLNSPALYYGATECVMMLICLYLAFYFTNYLQEARHTGNLIIGSIFMITNRCNLYYICS